MKVIIPVAGFGTRMRPHTNTKPKPLLSAAGRPAIAFILNELEQMNVSEIIFITGHLKEKFEDYITKNYKFKTRFIEQKVVNGTAGAINLAKEFIDEPVLIVFVDTVFEADLSIINKLKPDESGIIWTKEVDDYQRFGVCVMKEGYLSKIVEKPKEPISKLANIGMYYVKDHKLLFEGIHHVFEKNITLKGEYFLTDAFEYMVSKGAKFLCPQVNGWFDLGAANTTLESNRELLKKHNTPIVNAKNSIIIQPVFVSPTAVIENSIIGPNASIEDGTIVKNCIVRDSIICKNSKINDACIEASIIGDYVEITGKFKKLNLGDHSKFEL